MNTASPLHLYQQILLLSLDDQKGTTIAGLPHYLLSGAIFAELLLDGHITLEDNKKRTVHVTRPTLIQDPLLAESLSLITEAKKTKSLQAWISKLAGLHKLMGRATETLCDLGILRQEEQKVLGLFTRRRYPEQDHEPERQLINRLQQLISGPVDTFDTRDLVILALAYHGDLLPKIFDRGLIRQQKKHIVELIDSEPVGKATGDVLTAVRTAIVIATTVPVITAAGS